MGTLVVIRILCVQPLGMPAMILILGVQPLGTQSLLPWVQGSQVCQYLTQLFGTLPKKKNINVGYITIRKMELSALIENRIVGYAIGVDTQLLGMLAVIKILCTQPLGTQDRYHYYRTQPLGRLAGK